MFNIKYDCKEYSTIRKQEIKDFIANSGMEPKLVIIQIDSDPASNSYIKGKEKDCKEVGIKSVTIHIESEYYTQDTLCSLIKDINNNKNVHGIIIQLPIPDKYDIEELQSYISSEKDVDGFRKDSKHHPCTPKGIIKWMEYNDVDLVDTDIVVIGRSKIVGKPLVNMLIDKGANVTCLHSKTTHIQQYTQEAGIIISAVGKPEIFDKEYFSDLAYCSQLIIDVGINRDDEGKLCGDIDRESVLGHNDTTYVTPVPGGVGLLTRLALLENVVSAYALTHNKE